MSSFEMKGIPSLHCLVRNIVGFWVFLIIGIRRIGIYGAVVAFALVEEIEFDVRHMTVFIAGIADEPVVGVFCLTCHGDIITGFCLQIDAAAPVDSYILDKLERIG